MIYFFAACLKLPIRRYALLSGLAIGSACLFAVQAAEAAKVKGYFLHQHLLYEGPLKIISGKEGSRVLTKDLAIYMSLHNKDALVFNPANKKYCALNQQIWMNRIATDSTVTNIRTGKTINYQGHKATQYLGKANDSKGALRWGLEFWTAKDFDIPKKVQDDYCHLVGLPTGYGVPLYICRLHGDSREVFLGTYVVKNAEFDDSALKPPTSKYHKVADEMDVILGESNDEFNKILDDGGPAGKQPANRGKAPLR